MEYRRSFSILGACHRDEREGSASTSGDAASHPDLDFESDLTELSDDDEYVPEPPATEESEAESDNSSEADYLNGPLLNYEFEVSGWTDSRAGCGADYISLQHGEKVWVYAYDGWYPGSVLRRAQIPDRPKVSNATPR